MKIIAHRGNAPGFQELTPAGFEHALGLDIHGVECDVRLSKDGVVMVQHDEDVDRTSDGSGRVRDMTAAQLRELNIGTAESPQQMMTLDELLEIVGDAADKHLYLELKHPARFGPIVEEQVALRLRYAKLLHDPRIHLISFSHAAMRRMARLAPLLERFYLRRDWERRVNPGDVLLSAPSGLGLSLGNARARPRLVGAKGLPTYMWTVNDAADMTFARDVGVDVMATDNPEQATAVLGGASDVD